DLIDVEIVDDIEGLVCQIPVLAAGTTQDCALPGIAEAGQYANTATATGQPTSPTGDLLGGTVSDEDPSHYFGAVPAVDIAKNAEGEDSQSVPVGSEVTFDITVTNTGNVPLTDVTVTDPLTATCEAIYTDNGGVLAVGGVWAYSCTTTVTEDFVNVATVAGTDPTGATPSDSDPSEVIVLLPGIDLTKGTRVPEILGDIPLGQGPDDSIPGAPLDPGVDGATILAGIPIEWVYIVTNTGDVDLVDVVITDDPQGEVCTIPSLPIGATAHCILEGISIPGQYDNVGTAAGQTSTGYPVDDSDPSSYFGSAPLISIVKETITPQPVIEGTDVIFEITVTNTGNVPLTDVTVTDPLVAACEALYTDNGGVLEVAAEWVYECNAGPATADYVNVAFVVGIDPIGTPVGDDDDAPVFVVPLADLGDFVWEDLNANGIQDDGEPGIEGVLVTLENLGGIVDTRTTGPNGEYLFEDLVPDSYRLVFTAPQGYVFTSQDVGDDTTDSDADAAGQTAVFELLVDDMTRDAGLYRPAVIGDFAWLDVDGDGLQSDQEPGLPEVLVELLDAGGNVIDSTFTDDFGAYSFSVTPGTYSVRFGPVDPLLRTLVDQGDDALDSDANLTTGETPQVTLLSGDVNDTLDAGYIEPASIGDFVWLDLDGDGLQGEEPGIEGATVTLLGDDMATVVDTQVTGGDGGYLFEGLRPGTYYVTVSAPGLIPTLQDAGDDGVDSDIDDTGTTAAIDLAVGADDLTIDAGFVDELVIGDFIWHDFNHDGIQNDGDQAGLGGVTVRLLNAGGGFLQETVTDPIGGYQFVVLPGAYIVEVVSPAGTQVTLQNIGDDGLDSDISPTTNRTEVISVTADDLTIDAGFYIPVQIGDFVWRDRGATPNGLQDAGEPGIEGVTVQLLDDGGAVIDTDVTDEFGAYGFIVDPGTYSLQIMAPADATFTTQFAGDVALDSNADAAGAIAPFTVTSGQDDLTLDAGMVIPIDLEIAKEAFPEPTPPGSIFTYQVRVKNLGPADAQDVVILDLLPSRCQPGNPQDPGFWPECTHTVGDGPWPAPFEMFPTFTETADSVGDPDFRINATEPTDDERNPYNEASFVSVSAPAGVACAYDADVHGVRCEVGDLGIGDSVTIDIDLELGPFALTRVWNRAYTFADDVEGNIDRNDQQSLCATLPGDDALAAGLGCNYVKKNETIDAAIDLQVDKSVDKDTAVRGDSLTYTVTATNNGPSGTLLASIVDSLPEGVSFVEAAGCDYDTASHTVSCEVANWLPDESKTFTIEVTVDDDAIGTQVNTVTVSQEDPRDGAPLDENPDNDTASAQTVLVELEVLDETVTTTTAVETLPRTGADTGSLAIIGFLLVAGGALALVALRRRDDEEIG
ncbi:MAG: DUF11 domain-containing protein, partial [Acidimicrobiia bacterium]|nr:DUF11 domain-containing protein [Acidimicrobiia bacterium]